MENKSGGLLWPLAVFFLLAVGGSVFWLFKFEPADWTIGVLLISAAFVSGILLYCPRCLPRKKLDDVETNINSLRSELTEIKSATKAIAAQFEANGGVRKSLDDILKK